MEIERKKEDKNHMEHDEKVKYLCWNTRGRELEKRHMKNYWPKFFLKFNGIIKQHVKETLQTHTW